jgi:hypothetical protein
MEGNKITVQVYKVFIIISYVRNNIANAATTFHLTSWITLQTVPASSTLLSTCPIFCASGAVCCSAVYSSWYWVCTHQISGRCWTCFTCCSLCVHWGWYAKQGGSIWLPIFVRKENKELMIHFFLSCLNTFIVVLKPCNLYSLYVYIPTKLHLNLLN